MAEDSAGQTGPKLSVPKLALNWDTHTAVAVVVLGSLLYLAAIRRGFRPVLNG